MSLVRFTSPEAEERYAALVAVASSAVVGLDFDGDGVTDVSTYIVGPGDELPASAQSNGDPCHGVTSIETFFAECVG